MAFSIPAVQTAIWVDSKNPDDIVTLKHDVPVPKPKPNEVLVRIECSGICHSDVYNMTGAHPMDVNITGHEGIGDIVQMGQDVQALRLGQRVGVKWIHETCGACRDRDGTLQQYVVVPWKHATPIPDGIKSEIAAPLLCAGLTMYSAVKKSKTQLGDWIVIQGAGGGLGHIGIQVAALAGLKVIAIDREEKREFCLSLGAIEFLSLEDSNLEKRLLDLTGSHGAHAVICCVGAGPAYNQALRVLRRGGSLVCVGLPADGSYRLPLSPMDLVARGLNVLGSSVGTEEELQELLQLAIKGGVKPVVDLMPLEAYREAIELVKSSKAKGRIVLSMHR
ncbi:hypothetical protein G7046_g2623 [Stylonectria norvegica]|nr:hypothetical protein G7046_g2623 [Stylonectria norvegica]